MSGVWFTSDLHLGHERINELADRPFRSREEADASMVALWNERVAPGDAVFVLGDIAMGTLTESLALVSTLHGVKFLVPGNHDRVSHLYHGSDAKKSAWSQAYRDAGLIVLPDQHLHVLADGTEILLCHFPYVGDSQGEERYADARPEDTGLWLFHGHTHAHTVRSADHPRQIHVGVDAWNYAPVSFDELRQVMKETSE